MYKTPLKLAIRKIKKYKFQYLGIAILISVGLGFFLILATINKAYEDSSMDFFNSHQYADLTIYGNFSEDDYRNISNFLSQATMNSRFVIDYQIDQSTMRVISITNDVNQLYFYSGDYPNLNEVAVQKKYAESAKLNIGDYLEIDGKSFKISGIVTSPEYIYLVKNEQSFMLNGDNLKIVYVNPLSDLHASNELLIKGKISEEQLIALKQLYPQSIFKSQDQQINYQLFKADLDQIRTFSIVFPSVFFILIFLMIYVIINRNVQEERRQIGIYKALGYNTSVILRIYFLQVALITMFGIFISGLLTFFLTDMVIGVFSLMFEVPNLSFRFYPILWIVPIGLILFLNLLFCLFSLKGVLTEFPSTLLRPKKVKRNVSNTAYWLLKMFPNLSFNTKYAFKSMVRNKSRFFTIVAGITGTLSLLLFTFNFYESIDYTKEIHFNEFVSYDVNIEFDPIPLDVDHVTLEVATAYDKVLIVPILINDKYQKMMIVDDDFSAFNIDNSALSQGVILPRYLANELNIKAGEIIKFNQYEVQVSKIIDQYFSLSIYISRSMVESLTQNSYNFYNAIYMKTEDYQSLELMKRDYRFSYQTIVDEKNGFDAIMESLEGLIWFMLGASIILGIVVMFSMGQLNLTSRTDEYIFLRAIGYPDHKIRLLGIKELCFQFFIAVIASFWLSGALTRRVAFEFSSNQFVLAAASSYFSYGLSLIIGISISILTILYNSKYISSLNIVESMKLREDTF